MTPETGLSPAWEAMAQDIHAHGFSVRNALRKHRPLVEEQFVGALLTNFREYGASTLTGDDVADEIEGFVWRDEPRSANQHLIEAVQALEPHDYPNGAFYAGFREAQDAVVALLSGRGDGRGGMTELPPRWPQLRHPYTCGICRDLGLRGGEWAERPDYAAHMREVHPEIP